MNFTETADIETASDDYAARFAGPVGAWMLDVQQRIVLDFLDRRLESNLLDVGGGHGQLALPLSREKFQVTVTGSSEVCRRRIAALVDSGRCRFTVANALALPYADRSFDVVLCFRFVPHCRRWPELIKELCRVARRAVLVDYPTSQSLNRVAPKLFGAKRRLEGNTREFALFRHADIERAFIANEFIPARRSGQFLLPMVLHRWLGCRPLSALFETTCARAGLTRRWGSPVIVRMNRKPEARGP